MTTWVKPVPVPEVKFINGQRQLKCGIGCTFALTDKQEGVVTNPKDHAAKSWSRTSKLSVIAISFLER